MVLLCYLILYTVGLHVTSSHIYMCAGVIINSHTLKLSGLPMTGCVIHVSKGHADLSVQIASPHSDFVLN